MESTPIWQTFLTLEAGLLPVGKPERTEIIKVVGQHAGSTPMEEGLPNLAEIHAQLREGTDFSATLAPLDGSDACDDPEALAIWLMGGNAKPLRITQTAGLGVHGDSAELAIRLAQHLQSNKPSDMRIKVASEWVITGALDGDRVRKVEIGNKLELGLDRRWLMPAASTLPEKRPKLREMPRYVESFKEAVRTINGHQQTRNATLVDWPDQIKTLLTFGSRSVRPVIASALLSQPEELILLHSSDPDSLASIEVLEKVLGKLMPKTVLKLSLWTPLRSWQFKKLLKRISCPISNQPIVCSTSPVVIF